jgi:hypothetical protein
VLTVCLLEKTSAVPMLSSLPRRESARCSKLFFSLKLSAFGRYLIVIFTLKNTGQRLLASTERYWPPFHCQILATPRSASCACIVTHAASTAHVAMSGGC